MNPKVIDNDNIGLSKKKRRQWHYRKKNSRRTLLFAYIPRARLLYAILLYIMPPVSSFMYIINAHRREVCRWDQQRKFTCFFFLKEKDSELVACSRQALATIDHILPSGANKET